MRESNYGNQQCPDCGRSLHRIQDYPSNELWCVHCGNRYFATERQSDQAVPDKLAGFRVLMLDADSDRRDRRVAKLTRLGYLVTPVCHPRQAMEAVSFRRFDIAVIPSALPEFECLGFVTKLKLLMGSVKFVLFTECGAPSSAGVGDPDVVWVTMDDSDGHHLERIVERMVDDLISSRSHSSRENAVSRTLVGSV